MRISRYLIHERIGSEIVLLSTLWGSVVKIDARLESALRELLMDVESEDRVNVKDSIKRDILQIMQENKMVVDDLEEEYKIAYTAYLDFINRWLVFKIFTTTDCNFSCIYCYQNRNKKYMSQHVVTKIIQLIKKEAEKANELEGVYLTFFGGEPLLNKPVIRVILENIRTLKNVKIRVLIVTNGSLLDSTFVKYVSDNCDKLAIQLTIDGGKRRHNRYRPFSNGAPSYEIIMKNLESLDKLSLRNVYLIYRVNVDRTFSNNDILNLYKPLNLSCKISCVGIFDNPENPSNYNLNNERTACKCLQAAKDAGYEIIDFLINPLFSCSVGLKNTYTISPDGFLTICTGVDPKDENFYGYMSDDGSIVITNKNIHSKLFSEEYEFFNIQECRRCSLLPICFGGCAYSRKIRRNIPSCPAFKRYLRENIKLLI
ncbi:MAG: uncharacterized protein PWP37_1850 [Thermotogota bacterium]|nr:uncharacterized protein [Pseudothermotoga sp.]MDK2865658.1 uncharacterized protein [Thermotogota bacterium]HCZ07326.1 hypothetical protein [Thermotogota bacterium]